METSAPAAAALELDSEELFEAVDRERRHRRLKRHQAAAELGVSPTTWSCWSAGATIGSDAALRASVWLNRDLRDFAKPRAVTRAA
jgi:hypothetical protein